MYTDHTNSRNSTLYTLDWLEPETTCTVSKKSVSRHARSFVCYYTRYIYMYFWSGEERSRHLAAARLTPIRHIVRNRYNILC